MQAEIIVMQTRERVASDTARLLAMRDAAAEQRRQMTRQQFLDAARYFKMLAFYRAVARRRGQS